MCAIRHHSSCSSSVDHITLCFDISHAVYRNRLEQERCVFFNMAKCLSLCCNKIANDDCNKRSIDLLLLLTDTDEREFQQTVLSDIRCHFPIEFTSIHVVLRTTRSNVLHLPLAVSTSLPKIVGRLGNQIHFHVGAMGSSDVLHSLMGCFDIARIPFMLGGAWNINEEDNPNQMTQQLKLMAGVAPNPLTKRPRKEEESKAHCDDNVYDDRRDIFKYDSPKITATFNVDTIGNTNNLSSKLSLDHGDAKHKTTKHSRDVSKSSTDPIYKLCRDSYTDYIRRTNKNEASGIGGP